MSRIGKKPIQIPEQVDVSIKGDDIVIRGPKGELTHKIRPEVCAVKNDNMIFITQRVQTKHTNAMVGTTRAVLANKVKGVKEGFERKLQIEGIGFKANKEGEDLVLNVGFTHPVTVKSEPGVSFSIEKNIITVSGADNERVSLMAAKIKKVQPPEPYKGKGIRYQGEVVKRKLGKKAVAAAK